jgi:hypothetical protein
MYLYVLSILDGRAMNAIPVFDFNFKNADSFVHLWTLLSHLNLRHLQWRCVPFSSMVQAHLCILGL